MNAIIGGMGSALVFAIGLLLAAHSSRNLGPIESLAFVMGVGFVLDLPLVVATWPGHLGSHDVVWLFLSGVGNVGALLLAYAAFRAGPLGTGAAILSTEGAVTALIAAASGEHLSAAVVGALTAVVFGVVLASGVRRTEGGGAKPDRRHQFLLPMGGALSAGFGLYATGRVSTLPLPIVVLPPRAVGLVILTLPVLAAGRLRIRREMLPFVVGPGVTEVGGFFLYAWGARTNVATAAVLQSTFGAVTAALGFVFFRERLRPGQITGVIVIAAGVAALSLLTSV